jgi:hypothetical protein
MPIAEEQLLSFPLPFQQVVTTQPLSKADSSGHLHRIFLVNLL